MILNPKATLDWKLFIFWLEEEDSGQEVGVGDNYIFLIWHLICWTWSAQHISVITNYHLQDSPNQRRRLCHQYILLVFASPGLEQHNIMFIWTFLTLDCKLYDQKT